VERDAGVGKTRNRPDIAAAPAPARSHGRKARFARGSGTFSKVPEPLFTCANGGIVPIAEPAIETVSRQKSAD